MFGSLFRRRKSRSSGSSPPEDTIRSAGVGDVVVISGFSPSYEDAYFLIESVSRYESAFGKWHELIGVDGDRRVGIEWSDDDGLYISVSAQDAPMGLSSVGIDNDDLVRLDQEQSIDNYIEHEGDQYYYKNSYEVHYFKDNGSSWDGYYTWEFLNEDQTRTVSVVKWEGVPFEVYTSTVVSPNLVSVYKK